MNQMQKLLLFLIYFITVLLSEFISATESDLKSTKITDYTAEITTTEFSSATESDLKSTTITDTTTEITTPETDRNLRNSLLSMGLFDELKLEGKSILQCCANEMGHGLFFTVHTHIQRSSILVKKRCKIHHFPLNCL